MRKRLRGHKVQLRRLVYLKQVIRKRLRGHWVQVLKVYLQQVMREKL